MREGLQVRPTLTTTRRANRKASSENATFERPIDIERSVERASASVVPAERSESLSRILNVIVATVGLIVAAPVMLVIFVVIKLSSKGPALYNQTRVGLDRRWRETLALHERRDDDVGGRPFTMYKFRTMIVDAERNGAVWATQHDPRVTAFGRFLRKFRLDELPQLWNVLKGDMNIVGPRPERPTIVQQLRADIVEYQWRHRVKPGLTGWAQINQKYDTSIEDVRSKVRYDLEYIGRQSATEDLKIMLRTIPAVLGKFRGW